MWNTKILTQATYLSPGSLEPERGGHWVSLLGTGPSSSLIIREELRLCSLVEEDSIPGLLLKNFGFFTWRLSWPFSALQVMTRLMGCDEGQTERDLMALFR